MSKFSEIYDVLVIFLSNFRETIACDILLFFIFTYSCPYFAKNLPRPGEPNGE